MSEAKKKTFFVSAPIEFFTDGACKGNPGVGGWGAVLRYKDRQKEICDGEADTTNNRMELTAVIFALETLKKKMSCAVITDSQYVQRGMTEWLENWQRGIFVGLKTPTFGDDCGTGRFSSG